MDGDCLALLKDFFVERVEDNIYLKSIELLSALKAKGRIRLPRAMKIRSFEDFGSIGEMDKPLAVGALLRIVTFEEQLAQAPNSTPSFGRTLKCHSSPLEV